MERCKKPCSDKNGDDGEEMVLISGLPNHLAHLCLVGVHSSTLYEVCRSWRRFIYSSNYPPFFTLYALLSSNSSLADSFFSYDPVSCRWGSLRPPPTSLLRRHPSFISRILPIQSLTVSNRYLVIVAASDENFLPALRSPLIFDPLLNRWLSGPPMTVPRRWCIAGSTNGTVYVVSGFGTSFHSDVARSVEKWDMNKNEIQWSWENMAPYKNGRFSREAVEAVGYNGKLCMVNIKGKAAAKEAAAYDISTNRWETMPEGMHARWNGPAAVDDADGLLYVVDEAAGVLSRYVLEDDRWEKIVESECLRGVEQITAGKGRVCAVCGGGRRIVVVDVVARPAARIWMVNAPPDMEVVALHILPRMPRSHI